AQKERLDHGSIRPFLHTEGDRVPFRFLQEDLRDLEQRIGAPGHSDLLGQHLHSLILGREGDLHLRQRRRRLSRRRGLGSAVPASTSSLAPWRRQSAAAWGACGRGGPSAGGRLGAALGSAGAILSSLVAPLRFAFVFGVTIVLRRFLGPG